MKTECHRQCDSSKINKDFQVAASEIFGCLSIFIWKLFSHEPQNVSECINFVEHNIMECM